MKLAGIDFGKRLILAPMAEITDGAFRKISKKFGCGLTFTQMVSAEGILNNNFRTLRYLAFSRDEKPIGVQILGNNPQTLYQAVKELVNFRPDVIDLNSGCPVANVAGKQMGASLMEDPALLAKLVKAMVKGAGGIPVSVKFRLGKDAKNISILESAKIAEDNGASFITVHFRTMETPYEEEPDFEWFAKIKERVSIPVVVNGSIFSIEDALKLRKELNADALMVARGALGNPFIFKRFNEILDEGTDPGEPSAEEIYRTLFEHLNLLLDEFGEFKALDKAKMHAVWYWMRANGISELLKEIFSAKRWEELIAILNRHAEKVEKNLFPDEDFDLIQKKFRKKILFWLLN